MKTPTDYTVQTIRSLKKSYWDIRGGLSNLTLKRLTKEEMNKRQFFWLIPWYIDETCFQLWGKKDMQPQLVKRIKKNTGWEFIYTLPPGYCDDDFCNAEKYFYTAVGRRTLSIEIEGEAIHLCVATERLPGNYPFNWEWKPYDSKLLPLLCGLSVNGNKVIDLATAPHILIWGETGIGKSTLLRSMLTALILARDTFELYIIDRKGGSDFYFCRNHSETLIEPEDIRKCLSNIILEMNRRNALRAKVGAESIESLNEKTNSNLKRIVIVIDEYAELTKIKDIVEQVDTILRLGRASGLNIITCSQRTTSDMSEKIGSLKVNCPVKIGFALSRLNSNLLFDSERGSTVPPMIGRGLLKCERNMTEFQVPFIDNEKAEKLLSKVPVRKVSYIGKSSRILPPPKQNRNRQNRGVQGNVGNPGSKTP